METVKKEKYLKKLDKINSEIETIKKVLTEDFQKKEVAKKPLDKWEYKRAIYKGTKPINLSIDETYEVNKNLLIYHSDTAEEIESKVKTQSLPHVPEDKAEEYKNYLIEPSSIYTIEYEEQSLPKRPEPLIYDEYFKSDKLFEIINEKTGDEIKTSLISLLQKKINQDSTEIRISELFQEIKGKLYGDFKVN